MDEEQQQRERSVKGKEQYIVLGGKAGTVHVYDIEGRKTPKDIQIQFSGMRKLRAIFIRNKDLQRIPYLFKGSMIFLPQEKIIAMIVEARYGKAWVHQVYPPGNQKLLVCLLQDGWFLQQVSGKPFGIFDSKAKHRTVHRTLDPDGNVMPLLDSRGYIKLNTEGPDVMEIDADVPVWAGKCLEDEERQWVQWAPTTPTSTSIAAKFPNEKVPVLYVYPADRQSLRACRKGQVTYRIGKEIPSSSPR
jgi:hypothetical protein